jgi:hypothetical protein
MFQYSSIYTPYYPLYVAHNFPCKPNYENFDQEYNNNTKIYYTKYI